MTIAYNPFDPDQVDDDRAVLDALRHQSPVVEVLPGVFYVTRHDDVVAVSKDPVTFPQAPFRPLDEDTRRPDQLQLGESNPPEHTAIRKILQSVLNPRRIRALEDLVRDTCAELVEGFAGRDQVDLVAELARPLPTTIIGHLTGVPVEDRPLLHEYSDRVVAATQEQEPDARQAAMDQVEDFDRHLLEVIRARRVSGERPDDAMTALLEYRDENGRGLTDEKILLHLSKDLITGGIDTTTHLVGNLFYDLLRTPGAYQRVRQDRSLVPIAVEESLRVRPVVNLLFRRPPEDTEIAGVPIPGGSIVALGYASANHDESLFEDPGVFDLDRGDVVRRHLGFGWGTHLCVGAPLARLEGIHALEAVLDRVADMDLAPGCSYQRVRFFMMRGPVRLDVALTPAR